MYGATEFGIARRCVAVDSERDIHVPPGLAEASCNQLTADRRTAQFGRVLDEEHP
jgi:hypothetical protein